MAIKNTQLTAQSLGLYGSDFFTSADNAAGLKFCQLEAWGGDAVVTYTLTAEDTGNTITHTDVTIPDGRVQLGDISAVSVTSGTVLAYFQPGELPRAV